MVIDWVRMVDMVLALGLGAFIMMVFIVSSVDSGLITITKRDPPDKDKSVYKWRFHKKAVKQEKGFTLIELLVVVAILGILAAVITPNVMNFIKEGQAAGAAGELASVQTAVDAYVAANHGALPADVGDCSLYIRGEIKGTYEIGADGTIKQLTTGY